MVVVDALILAGGRASRLDGSAKQKFEIAGRTLLDGTIEAARGAGARQVVVVGDDESADAVTVREDPPFGGPVAAIARGLRELDASSDVVLVLACDMPGIARALPALLNGLDADGAIAVDRGRRQQLALALRTGALRRAVDGLPIVEGAAVRDLIASLDLREVTVTDGSTDDIDTWADADRFGARRPTPLGSTT